jgi:LuxR family maltose regulon positive regulatory protein
LWAKLILVSAPAGFGKTTIVANWIDSELAKKHGGRVAWLSLDENDNDLPRFFTYFIAALQNIAPGLGEELGTAFSASQNPQIDVLLTLLVNEIAAVEVKLILVIDDFHLISSLEIHQAIQFLIENHPPNLLLVIASRDEPFLPLPRLRARGQMVDLRAGDLRFSHQEATLYLNQTMNLGLTEDDILALETRTEGWITGLRLAALSIQGQDDPKSFISEFAGDNRYIIDYLVDEVLSHRSENSRKFLLRTSILSRLTGPLCQTIAQLEDAREILGQLEQENVFIVPLDNRRQWYRYHHLFADVLHQRLAESVPPEEIADLHRRASRWFEENDSLIEAVEHAFQANEPDEVIRLVEAGAEEMFLNSQLNTLLGWHDRLPHLLIDSHPKLCLIFAWAWVSTSRLNEAEHCLQTAEKALDASLSDLLAAPESNVDATTRGALLETAVMRAQLAIGRGDIPEALRLSGFSLPYLEDDDGPYLYNPPMGSRMAAYFIRGLAQKLLGDLDQAAKDFVEAGALAKKLNHVHVVALAHGHLANLLAIQGHLHQTLETCQRGLSEVVQIAGEKSPLSGFLLAEYGNLLYERNDLETAEEYFREAVQVAKPWGFLDAIIPGLTGLAQMHAARGNGEAAFEALDELEKLGRDNLQHLKPVVESQRALLWIGRGNLDQVQRWVETAGLDPAGELAYHREDEYIILVQVLLAQKKLDEAAGLINRLLEVTKTGGRGGRVIKLLALQALVFQIQGKRNEAAARFDRALSLAAPEGYVRTFVDLGTPVQMLLQASKSAHPEYARELLAAFGSGTRQKDAFPVNRLVEPLSERELEVLRLLATELTGPEIARELVIAVSTLRTHTQQIYRKLGVTNRRAALKAARALQLL